MKNAIFCIIGLILFFITEPLSAELKLESVEKLWDQSPHNAFSSLIHHKDGWFCSFREGISHAGKNGNIRVLKSEDGKSWKSSAELFHKVYDLRDPKLSTMPDGRLMIVGGALQFGNKKGIRFSQLRTFVSFSDHGIKWTEPKIVLNDWEWLWRITWHKGTGYGLAYHVGLHGQTPRHARYGTLYKTTNGLNYEAIHKFETDCGVGETTLRFDKQDKMYLIMRTDGRSKGTRIGTSVKPYDKWNLKTTLLQAGGPDLIQLKNGQWITGTRYKSKTILASVDFEAGKIASLITLPSGGDCSYPGMVLEGDILWMSYYSSHEGKSKIYLAKLRIENDK